MEKNVRELKKLLVVNRIRLLELLLGGQTCVCEMVKLTGLKHNLISHHLKTLSELGYITSAKNGQHVLYSLESSKRARVENVIELLARLKT